MAPASAEPARFPATCSAAAAPVLKAERRSSSFTEGETQWALTPGPVFVSAASSLDFPFMPEDLETHARQIRVDFLDRRRFLDAHPIVKLTGEEFPKADTPLAERVADWYAENGLAEVQVSKIGLVKLDRRAVGRSMAHRLGRTKAAAFAAVPHVLIKGIIIHKEPLRGSRNGAVYHIAAPVQIAEEVFIVDVLVKSDSGLSRMYVHDITPRKRLQESEFKIGADAAAGTGERSDTDFGAMRRVLRRIYAVKEA